MLVNNQCAGQILDFDNLGLCLGLDLGLGLRVGLDLGLDLGVLDGSTNNENDTKNQLWGTIRMLGLFLLLFFFLAFV